MLTTHEVLFQGLKHGCFFHPYNNPMGIIIPSPLGRWWKWGTRSPTNVSQSSPSRETPSPRSYSATPYLSATIINPIPGGGEKTKGREGGWAGEGDIRLGSLWSVFFTMIPSASRGGAGAKGERCQPSGQVRPHMLHSPFGHLLAPNTAPVTGPFPLPEGPFPFSPPTLVYPPVQGLAQEWPPAGHVCRWIRP